MTTNRPDRAAGAAAKYADGIAPSPPDRALAEITTRLRAGELSPTDAVDALIELSLDAEVGSEPARRSLRDQIRKALWDLVESDPGLARRLSAVGITKPER